MHLISYVADQRMRVGVTPDGGASCWDVATLSPGMPADVVAIASSPELRERLAEALRAAPPTALEPVAPESMTSPVTRPGKIIGIGLNYVDHATESGQQVPDQPLVFAKFPTAIAGPHDPIVYPAGTSRLDYEAELGVVIGRRCRRVAQDEAVGVVAGYVVVNDVSARDVQNSTSQWTLGKSFDSFCPLGPALVTADEIADPQTLRIRLWVGDELRQDSNTANMIFGVYELIERLSAVCTLEPGDIIATGTPAGVGIGFRPERLLSVGDQVTVTIDGVGTLKNAVVAEQDS